MSIRPYRDIHRRACRKIYVGKVPVGGDAPITVQSMTNTVTSDVKATVEQVQALERAGADIVRVSCPDQESALALKHIVREVDVPIVADIHFHYRRAIEAAESGGLTQIYCTILVERESQKPIVVGKGGAMIKAIGTAARAGLERFLATRVFLDLHVKVKSEWRDNERLLDELGLHRSS